MKQEHDSYKVGFRIVLIFLLFSIGTNVGLVGYYKRSSMHQVMQQSIGDYEPATPNETYYEERLERLFPKEELVELASKQWGCMVAVNGNEFKSNTQYVSSENIRIALAEVTEDATILPASIMNLGRLERNESKLLDHIKVYSEIPYEVTTEEINGGIKYYLDFVDVPSQSIIILQISEVLKTRLTYHDQIKADRLEIIKQ